MGTVSNSSRITPYNMHPDPNVSGYSNFWGNVVTIPAGQYVSGTHTVTWTARVQFKVAPTQNQVLQVYLAESGTPSANDILIYEHTFTTLRAGTYTFPVTNRSFSGANTQFTGKSLGLRFARTSRTQSLATGNFNISMEIEVGKLSLNTAAFAHTITCNAGTGGTLTASAASAAPGTTVTLTPTPNTGYQLTGYTTNPTLTITNNQFTMPDSAVTITANFAKVSYSISCTAGTGGSLSANKSDANYGDTITLTPVASAGYYFTGYTPSPAVVISNNEFTMPDSNVNITANFAKITYSVSALGSTGGTLSADKSTATVGEAVTLTPTPDTGYELNGYTTSPTGIVIINNVFNMPADNTRITANFSAINYSISAGAGTGGSLSASKSTATIGTEVTLTPVASSGYYFTDYTVEPSGVIIADNKFIMPAGDVSITANFAKLGYAITRATIPEGAGSVTTSAANAEMGETITISQTPNTGYYFNGWVTSPAVTITNDAFVMPASNITVTAKYLQRSTAGLSKITLEGGGTAALSINTESIAYSHKYQLSFGTGMDTGLVDVAAGTTSLSIDIPLNWSAAIPNATSKTGGTLTLYTYNGTTQIGSYTITGLTYTVPGSVKPSVGTITTSLTGQSIDSYYVQNHSGVRIQASASGDQNSTVENMSVSITGYTGSNYSKTVSATSIDFTSEALSIAGETTITVTATDSRGRTASRTTTITVQAYSKPGGTLNAWRVDGQETADNMGEYGAYSLTKQYTQLGTNTLTWEMTVKYGSSTIGTVSSPGNSGDLLPGNRMTFDQTKEYDILLTLEDDLESVTISTKLPSARFIMFVESSGNKLGFMKVPNKAIPSGKNRTVEFSADTQIYIGDMTLEDYIRSIV